MKNSNKGLNHDEPILFDIGDIDKSGVDLNNSTFKENLIGGCFDDREIGLPGLSDLNQSDIMLGYLERIILLMRDFIH